jgi:hypothetical protein
VQSRSPLFALGINKQLDLQTALTELRPVLAFAQGWYERSQVVQFWFIVAVAATCLLLALILIVLARRAPCTSRLDRVGRGACLRDDATTSFHHFDRFIGTRVLGLKWNWP